MKLTRSLHTLCFLISAVLLGVFPAAAQSASMNASSAKKSVNCSGAWTGVIILSKSQSQNTSKTVERVSQRGRDTRNFQMNLNYTATVGIIEDPAHPGSSLAKATIHHEFSSNETSVAVEKNSCDGGKTWQDMTGTFTTETKISGSGRGDANVNIGMNDDGSYAIGVGVPEIQGTLSGSDSSAFSGQCRPKAGKNHTLAPTPYSIQGASLTSDGKDRVNPDDANRISGSYSLPLPGGVLETLTWNLQRCAAPLRIIELKFEDMKYPKWDDWHEVEDLVGTVDGNWVKVKAKVFNGSGQTKTAEVHFKATYQGDKWDGAEPDTPLKDQVFTVTLEGGEEKEVEMLWDTSGYSWYDDGRPRLVQRIKAEVYENFKKTDELVKNIKVRPRPLVIIPGIWTKPADLETYQNILTASHSYDWKACTVTQTSPEGTISTESTVKPVAGNPSVYENADNLTNYINSVRHSLNAWHIDILAHCTGGLVARLYIHKQMDVLPDGHPVAKHLLMAGTPNNGVSCTNSISFSIAPFRNTQTEKELAPDQMALFNKYVTQRKGTKFSALVGNNAPLLCLKPVWNDGFVEVDSAKYGVEDVTLTSTAHTNLLSTELFTSYVKPHIVTGPQGTYPLAATSQSP
jgi:hypothetical protein